MIYFVLLDSDISKHIESEKSMKLSGSSFFLMFKAMSMAVFSTRID